MLSDSVKQSTIVDHSISPVLTQQTLTNSVAQPKDIPTAPRDLTCSLGAFPASSVHGIPQDSSTSVGLVDGQTSQTEETVTPDDLLIASYDAQAYFQFFRTKLDPMVYGVLKANDSIQAVLKRSTLLAFALCATVAYCTGDDNYPTWQNRLKELVVEKTFKNRHTFDDVRALCIGALWLDDMATALNALGR